MARSVWQLERDTVLRQELSATASHILAGQEEERWIGNMAVYTLKALTH